MHLSYHSFVLWVSVHVIHTQRESLLAHLRLWMWFQFFYKFQILSVFSQSLGLPSWNLPVWMNHCILGCSVHLFPLNSRFHIGGGHQQDCVLWWCSVTTDAGKAQKATQDVNNALKLLNTTVLWVPKFSESFYLRYDTASLDIWFPDVSRKHSSFKLLGT